MNNGRDGARRARVRMRDVAAAASVDVSVVSRVLSGDSRLSVRPETRQRVVDAAERLNYRPHRAARSLKTDRTMAIGMVVPDLTNVVFSTIATGAEERAAAAGYVLLVTSGSAATQLPELEGRIDGLIVGAATTEAIPRIAGAHLPTVLVARHEPGGIASVIVDDTAGAELASRHLVSLGHRRIAHVAGPQNADTARRRLAGYRAALTAAGIQIRPEWIAEAPFDEAGGHVAANRLLRLEPRPTAIFAASIRTAIGAMAAVKRLGLRIPEDVSLVGFHDVPLAMYLDPPLTTVRMPLVEMGRQAVDSLLSLVAGQPLGDIVVSTPAELVVRASAAPPQDA